MTISHRLSAQPIDEEGCIGFDDRKPIEHEDVHIVAVFQKVASEIARYPEHDAWDLTLEIEGSS